MFLNDKSSYIYLLDWYLLDHVIRSGWLPDDKYHQLHISSTPNPLLKSNWIFSQLTESNFPCLVEKGRQHQKNELVVHFYDPSSFFTSISFQLLILLLLPLLFLLLFSSLSLSLFFSFFFCCRLPLFLSFFSSSFFFLPDFFGWYRARYKDRPVKAYTHSSRFVPLWIYLLRIVCLLYNPSHSLILMFTLEIVFIASILDVTKSSCIWMPEISQRCSKDIIWRPCDWYALKSQRWRFRWRTIVHQKSNNQLELGRRKCAPISANS